MATADSQLIVHCLRLISEFYGTEWLPTVIINHVKPNTLHAHSSCRRLSWISGNFYGEINFPDVNLEHEIYTHDPALMAILKLMHLNKTHSLPN